MFPRRRFTSHRVQSASRQRLALVHQRLPSRDEAMIRQVEIGRIDLLELFMALGFLGKNWRIERRVSPVLGPPASSPACVASSTNKSRRGRQRSKQCCTNLQASAPHPLPTSPLQGEERAAPTSFSPCNRRRSKWGGDTCALVWRLERVASGGACAAGGRALPLTKRQRYVGMFAKQNRRPWGRRFGLAAMKAINF